MLSIPLFRNKTDWHQLLANGVRPLVQQLFKEKILQCYHIELNYSGGENIRLPLFVDSKDGAATAALTHDYFTSFFLKNTFSAVAVTCPVNDLFMPFPTNSIQYGLYAEEDLQLKIDYDHTLKQCLSEILIDLLEDSTIEENEMITFSFYFHLALLKVISQKMNFKLQELLDHEPVLRRKNGTFLNPDILEGEFNANKELLLDIKEEIINPTSAYPDWMNAWMTSCENRVVHRPSNNSKLLYEETANLINTQFGLTEDMRLMLYYFLTQAIKS